MAIWSRKPPKGLIFYSDRGNQYGSLSYQQLLTQHEKFMSRSIAKNHIFEYIEIYYNRKRLHSRLDYRAPDEFEARKVA